MTTDFPMCLGTTRIVRQELHRHKHTLCGVNVKAEVFLWVTCKVFCGYEAVYFCKTLCFAHIERYEPPN